jgi:hypothetical protein
MGTYKNPPENLAKAKTVNMSSQVAETLFKADPNEFE